MSSLLRSIPRQPTSTQQTGAHPGSCAHGGTREGSRQQHTVGKGRAMRDFPPLPPTKAANCNSQGRAALGHTDTSTIQDWPSKAAAPRRWRLLSISLLPWRWRLKALAESTRCSGTHLPWHLGSRRSCVLHYGEFAPAIPTNLALKNIYAHANQSLEVYMNMKIKCWLK